MNKSNRIHGMDALRGIAMWLGVVLHTVIAYQVSPRSGWPADQSSSIFMDWIYDYLHAFRMPLFFLVAGYFANFLIKRIGLSPFVRHRFKRIFLPFVFSIIFIVPICSYVFALYRLHTGEFYSGIWSDALSEAMKWTGVYHIWFLYYLIILYVIFVFITYINPNIKKLKITETGFLSSVLVLIIVQYSFFNHHIEPWTGLVPKIAQILYYGFFFGLGFAMFFNNDFLYKHKKLRLGYLMIGSIIFVILRFTPNVPYFLYSVLISVQTFLLVFGYIALFIHQFNRDIPWIRYFSDAAYWFYLIHFPIVVFLQIWLMDFNISIWIKAFFILSFTTIFSIVTYETMVRYTFIGTLLHGKKERQKKLKISKT